MCVWCHREDKRSDAWNLGDLLFLATAVANAVLQLPLVFLVYTQKKYLSEEGCLCGSYNRRVVERMRTPPCQCSWFSEMDLHLKGWVQVSPVQS